MKWKNNVISSFQPEDTTNHSQDTTNHSETFPEAIQIEIGFLLHVITKNIFLKVEVNMSS